MDEIEMTETAPRQWESAAPMQRRKTTAARVYFGVLAATYALIFLVLWVTDFK